jgi:YceG-like Ter operon protein
VAKERRSDPSLERTEEERERARAERERRRIERAAGTKPDVPPLPPPQAELPAVQRLQEEPLVGQPLVAQLPQEEPPAAPPAQAELPVAQPPRSRSLAAQPPGNGRVASDPSPPRAPRRARSVARIPALLGLAALLGALAAGAALLVHRSERPKIPPIPKTVKVVIPEGYTRAQIAALAHADGLRGSYLVASKRSRRVRPSHYGAPAATPNLEGFLFPASYELYVGAPASRLVSEQLAAFRHNFGGGEVHRAKALGVTPYELLIVASIVEREAAIAHDRPLVAAVVYNRLRLGMTLGIDSTLRYALHDFIHPLTQAELASHSPYNTRTHTGLPPTPISNPGAAAIAAAARPARVSYLYYVAGADGCGEQEFSTSYAEFEKHVAAYREALRRNGGRVPSCEKR